MVPGYVCLLLPGLHDNASTTLADEQRNPFSNKAHHYSSSYLSQLSPKSSLHHSKALTETLIANWDRNSHYSIIHNSFAHFYQFHPRLRSDHQIITGRSASSTEWLVNLESLFRLFFHPTNHRPTQQSNPANPP